MNEITLTFPDGNTKSFAAGVSILDVAASISSSLKKRAVAGIVNEELYDLNRPIEVHATVKIMTEDDELATSVLNHSSAHMLAQAVKRLFPDAKFGVGPAIEEGFYYDIDSGETKITEDDLQRLEKEMHKISSENLSITRRVVSKDEAREIFAADEYKLEILSEIPENEQITIYTQGEFTDLCAGGHIGFTSKIKYFKLLSIAGAYWRGDSERTQLQRIYGYAAFSQKAVDDYLLLLQDRRERDHRKIGKELELFTFNELAGKGLAMWLPNGASIRRTLERYIVDKEIRHGYEHVYTPAIGSVDLYKVSGHWEHYQEDMFPPMKMDENESLVLRPMTCPHHMMIYGNKPRSYRELPVRIGELGLMHRFEKSGALTGLERVRGMCLNDAHLFVRPDQIASEFSHVLKLIHEVYDDLAITPAYYRLSLRDPNKTDKYYDDDAMWETSQNMLRQVLDEADIPYVEAEDEAAFYGPKLDIQMKSAIGHEFTLSTIQLDFLLPERFDLTYIGEDGKKHRPVVIHRGIISTMERMSAYLIEHYKGAFPLWLAPEQVRIIPVSPQVHGAYANQINELLLDEGYRSTVDVRDEKLGFKIREAQTEKVSYTLILGDKEVEQETVSFRLYGESETTSVSQDVFLAALGERRKSKR
jgi:threonyl-tRNA synthetase